MRTRIVCLIELGVLALAVAALSYAQNPAGPPLPEGATALRDLEYARIGERSLRLDLYLPAQPTERRPVIIWIHGGGWQSGSKSGTPALPMLRQGYAVASVEYRLSPEAPFPAQIYDCKAAVRWLANGTIDTLMSPGTFSVSAKVMPVESGEK